MPHFSHGTSLCLTRLAGVMQELLLSPKRLHDASIPFVKVLQHPGEMIVNSPGAYHAGFNSGLSAILLFLHKTCCGKGF